MSEKSTFDILDFTYKAVMEWLKFAEQKTAGLLILNSGVIWAYLRLLNKQEIAYSWLSYVNVVSLVLLILSSVICIVSLMPVLDSFWYFDAGKNKDKNKYNRKIFCFRWNFHRENILCFHILNMPGCILYNKIIETPLAFTARNFIGCAEPFLQSQSPISLNENMPII